MSPRADAKKTKTMKDSSQVNSEDTSSEVLSFARERTLTMSEVENSMKGVRTKQ